MERNLEEYYNSMRSIAMTVTYSPTVKDYYRQDEKGRIMEREEVAAVFSNALLLEESISRYLSLQICQWKKSQKSVRISEMRESMPASVKISGMEMHFT